jgi:hypothetical protein
MAARLIRAAFPVQSRTSQQEVIWLLMLVEFRGRTASKEKVELFNNKTMELFDNRWSNIFPI